MTWQIKEEMGGVYGTYRKPEGESPLERPRRRSEDDIKMDISKNGMGA
jgi:hypothetical protein